MNGLALLSALSLDTFFLLFSSLISVVGCIFAASVLIRGIRGPGMAFCNYTRDDQLRKSRAMRFESLSMAQNSVNLCCTTTETSCMCRHNGPSGALVLKDQTSHLNLIFPCVDFTNVDGYARLYC